MPLLILGAVVIICCLAYIYVVNNPEIFVGKGKNKQDGFDAEDADFTEVKDESKVIFLDDFEAAKRSRDKK